MYTVKSSMLTYFQEGDEELEKVRALYFQLDRAEERIHKILEGMGALLLAVSFVSIFVQISYRFVLCKFMNLPLSFTEELSRFCLFWLVYLMLPLTIKQGLESVNTFLPDRLTGRRKLALFFIVRGICIFVAAVAFIYSFSVLSTNWTYRSPAMRWPGAMMYLPVTIGLSLVFFRYVIEIFGLISKEIKPFEAMGKGGSD